MAVETWGFLGCGNLAQAIIGGALRQNLLKPTQVFITNRSFEKSREYARVSKVLVFPNNSDLVRCADIIFLGTKPQDMIPALEEISPLLTSEKIVVSLAAGVSSVTLKKYLSKARTVARVMANTPALIEKGLFGLTFIQGTADDQSLLKEFLSKLGHVVVVPGDKEINAITSVVSGVGFVLKMMEEFESWLVKKGFDKTQARQITIETYLGTAELAKARSDVSLSILREAVTSKKGTTLAGLNAMKAAKVPAGLRLALDAAYQRAVEISKSLLKNKK